MVEENYEIWSSDMAQNEGIKMKASISASIFQKGSQKSMNLKKISWKYQVYHEYQKTENHI